VKFLNPDFGSTGGGTTITVKGAGSAPSATAAKKGKAGAVELRVTVSGKTSKKRPPIDQFTHRCLEGTEISAPG
jgi:hypothetical protein